MVFIWLLLVWITAIPAQQVRPPETPVNKFEQHERFDDFKEGKFVIVGRIKNYRFRGNVPGDGRAVLSFHEISFNPRDQIRGNYLERIEKARRAADLEVDPDLTVTALFSTTGTIVEQATKSDELCIIVLEPIRASAMAGTIPVRINHVTPATDELIRVARAAADRVAKDKENQKRNDKSGNTKGTRKKVDKLRTQARFWSQPASLAST